jgi:hypothetical protein
MVQLIAIRPKPLGTESSQVAPSERTLTSTAMPLRLGSARGTDRVQGHRPTVGWGSPGGTQPESIQQEWSSNFKRSPQAASIPLPPLGERSSRLENFLNRGRLLGERLDLGIREHHSLQTLKVVALDLGYCLLPLNMNRPLPYLFRVRKYAIQAAIELEQLFDWQGLQPICGEVKTEVERVVQAALAREQIDEHWAIARQANGNTL